MMVPASKSDLLVELARSGPVRARDLRSAGIPRVYLKRLQDRGLLEQVDRGVYELVENEATELHSLAQVAKRVPHATICLLSALQFHHLTTEAPHAVWVMIDRSARSPKVAYPRLEIVRASGDARTHGIETHHAEGVELHVTSRAKTVADCFRFRNHVGLEVAIEALRQYLAERSKARGTGTPPSTSKRSAPSRQPIDEVVAAATADRVLGFMRPYLEALA